MLEMLIASRHLMLSSPCPKRNSLVTPFCALALDTTSTSSAKNNFQEYVQKRKLGSISYELLWKKGPEHMPEFRVACTLNGTKIAEGSARTKKMAEAVAADLALNKLKKQGGKGK